MRPVFILITLIIISTLLYSSMKKKLLVEIRFIPIGDSYSIGEGVSEHERWPNLLTEHFLKTGIATELVVNPGKTGWTTEHALDYEVPIVEKEKPNLVSILIGVNDLVQGVAVENFHANLNEILDRTRGAVGPLGEIILITIPDFTLTPAGKSFGDQKAIQAKLAEFNAVIQTEAKKRSLPLADIYALSLRLGENPLYITHDGLHPSAEAYIEWEKTIFEALSK